MVKLAIPTVNVVDRLTTNDGLVCRINRLKFTCPQSQSGEAPSGERLRGKVRHCCRLVAGKTVSSTPERLRVLPKSSAI